ncbi:MAG TPA: tetratricopeptide repeat protein [Blastocatellia bacterium]|nr:tetratricopeptide repeat protein [Blastocatellia bacterium]
MKLAFLRTKIAIVLIGLLAGLAVGFKIANSQYRNEQGASLSRTVAKASSAAGDGQNLSPEQQNQIISQVKAVIEKATGNPQDFDAQLEAADQFIQINRPEEAIKFLEQATKINPKDARATAGLGMAHFMSGKYDEAIKWSKQSIGLKAENPGATFILVASYIRSNRNLDEAERLINQLESQGVDREMINQARQELTAAKSGAGSGSVGGSQSVLDHGPQESKPEPKQNGGPR